jgi:putative transposase
VRYQGVRPGDVALREWVKHLTQERRRFDVLLRREGHAVNRKRVQRLYREQRLTVRRRGGRKRAMGRTGRPMVTPLAPDQRWSLDFVADQPTDGRRSASWRWSTTAPENAWRWSATLRDADSHRFTVLGCLGRV